MEGGRRTDTFIRDSASSSSINQSDNSRRFRYLTKNQLGGVIFGCKNNTMQECLDNQLFGLPDPHFEYVKNIDPGLPLFLFNYNTRELHGIYEAASSGNMNINPYGWALDTFGITEYPAQVQMRPRLLCKPLAENLFEPIIKDNYYDETHFMFELDHVQTYNLISKFMSCVLGAPIRSISQNAANWRSTIQGDLSNDKPRYAAECSSSGASIAVMNAEIQREDNNGEISLDLAGYPAESIFLIGGYNGESWLSTLESYAPSDDVVKSFTPMNSIRLYPGVAKLFGELFIFGGGGSVNLWHDTVESYSPADNKWTTRSPMNTQKGALAGASWKDKIFAIGGGNAIDRFSEVEMYDPQVGRWMYTRPMSQKRSCVAAAELNGALYAVGGYDGSNYLSTAERFDPREHSWKKIRSMSTRRGCHNLAVLDEKLYALGGSNGSTMLRSTEIYDPRFGTWMFGEPMKLARGYSAAAVLQDSIYVIGGANSNEDVVDMIECYKHGQGWHTPNLTGIGKRCLSSAIVLSND